MHSHTGCIYLTFLNCALSNASSNCLPESMHSHTGCIYLTFLNCALSNASSNCLPESMHSHTGCIYLTFLNCALSNKCSQCDYACSQTGHSNTLKTRSGEKPKKCNHCNNALSE